MTETIRIPKVFFDHHVDIMGEHGDGYRTVPALRETKRHYYIDASDSTALRFLVWDAEYWDDFYLACPDTLPLIHSARATHRAVKVAMGWNPTATLPRPPGQGFEELRLPGRGVEASNERA
jgi:hypothetical protein